MPKSKKKPHRPTRINKTRTLGAPPTSQLTPSSELVQLDLACGQTPKAGFEGVDLFAPNAKHKIDLSVYPWPWADNSVDEIYCSHYIEHIVDDFVDGKGDRCKPGTPGAKDALFKFFDECYRILKPSGWLEIVCPTARSHRGFQDPTHRRFIVGETFTYLWAEWRRANQLDHYNVDCDFGGNLAFSTSDDIAAKHAEAQKIPLTHYWNTIHDWIIRLQAHKPNRMLVAAPATS